MIKLDYRKVFLLGFGFFGISLLWAIYNAFVPLFLQAGNSNFQPDDASKITFGGFGLSAAATGLIMSLDNIAAVFIQPWIGVKSDATRTRFGRRIPFILVGAPLTVMGFVTIPFVIKMVPIELSGWLEQLLLPFALLVFALGITLLAAAIFRTPAVALMPDIVPSKFRSPANGIINLMGGLGFVVALLAGGWLFDIDIIFPFVFGGLLVLISSGIVVAFIREPRLPEELSSEEKEKQPGLMQNLRMVATSRDKSVLFLLLAIFAWFLAYNSLETFFTSYAVADLGLSPGKASQLFTIAGAAFILFAVPSGYVAAKIGRKRTIIIGLAGFALAALSILFTRNVTVLMVALGVVGLCWAMVNINSLPMVVDSVSQEQLGTYTGLYYFASMSAAIVGPIVIGLVVDGFGYRSMFGASTAALILAAVFVSQVTRGEALSEEKNI